MDGIEELQQKIFVQCKEILEFAAKSETAEELMGKQGLLLDVFERIGFLKTVERFPDVFAGKSTDSHHIEVEKTIEDQPEQIIETNPEPIVSFTPAEPVENEAETILEKSAELPIITENASEKNEGEQKNETVEDLQRSEPEPVPTEFETHSDEEVAEELIAEAALTEENYERSVELKEQELQETAEEPEHPKEKKFRLANIKGLKHSVQSLFDDDLMPEQTPPSSITKSNVPLDFMEAEKSKPAFKLDLNDRIAFTQKLFGGSQTELNETVQTLNSFKTLDEAKEYLSDIYYQRNWKKADDYAQRLWTLVENKFL